MRSLRTALLISLFGPAASIGVLLCRWVYLHQSEPDFWLLLADFFVVLLPFASSIFFAFVPDIRAKSMVWRAAVVVIGLAFSVVLWEQQQLAMKASARDQQTAIDTAVSHANQHSDVGIAGVEKQLEGATQKLDGKMDRTETNITTQIGKVIIPPPKYAQLQFMLWPDDARQRGVATKSFKPDNGVFTVGFTVTNISDTAATTVDITVQICDECSFAEEPPGFEKLHGADDRTRHKQFAQLNPGISLEEMTIKIKPSQMFKSIPLSFRYSCATCGKMTPPQGLTVISDLSSENNLN